MTGRDSMIALSLANLVYLDVWVEFLSPLSESDRSFRPVPGIQDFAALMANVLLLSLVFAAVATIARRIAPSFGMKVVRWAFLLSLLLPLNQARVRYQNKPPLEETLVRFWASHPVILILGALLGVLVIFRFETQMARAATAALLILSPFMVLTFARALWGMTVFAHAYAPASMPHSPTAGCKEPQRVIWLIFDGMNGGDDVFGRSAKVPLPNLTRFRQQSIYAPLALAPGVETRVSMPSYILGREIAGLTRTASGIRYVARADNQSSLWEDAPTIFSKAKQIGLRTALSGWYLPYCSVMSTSLDLCFTQFFDTAVPNDRSGILSRMAFQAERRLPFYFNAEHVARARNALAKAIEIGTDPDDDFVMIHWPVPHFPEIYDRNSHRYTRFRSFFTDDAYLDNAVLADDLFGEFQSALQRSGLWDSTIIIVTADHASPLPPRPDISKIPVPFFIKMRKQDQGAVLDFPIETLSIHDLSLEMMCGRIKTPSETIAWMNLHH
jgi:hypothetical protein